MSASALSTLPVPVRRPRFDRARLTAGMVHLGVGAFHRAHQAEYTDDALEAEFGAWGTVGVNLRPPFAAAKLNPQDGLYSRALLDGTTRDTRVIGSLLRAIDVSDTQSADAALQLLADPAIRVVTLTITEKGYAHTPATGRPDEANADLRHDREGRWPPRTAPGLLVAALERRFQANAPGVALLSCDNVPANGALLRGVVAPLAAERSAGLLAWVEANVAFPSSMVDRIAPALSAEDARAAEDALGLADEAAVVAEPFRQWVLEDFDGPRPAWARAGVQFVRDVAPFELTKMRVLNAAQSVFSHLGALLGHRFSFEAAADPILLALVRAMLERETLSTLPPAPGMEPHAYTDTALRRIANPAIHHRCHQIATDGSQKIVQRLVNPLRERLGAGAAFDGLALGVASWLAYALSGAKRFGARWQADDPWGSRVTEIGEAEGGDIPGLARALLSIQPIFGTDLAASPAADAVTRHLAGLLGASPRAYLDSLVRGS